MSTQTAPTRHHVGRLRHLVRAAAIALLAACGGDPAGVAGPPAAASRPGFDTSIYPGDAAMRAWRAPGSPYAWVGYYLPAPCHRDASWTGRRAALAADGWGFAVLYVGQQTWDGAATMSWLLAPELDVLPFIEPDGPRLARLPASGGAATCSRTLLTAAQGTAEGDDAVERTAAEGFPRGTTVFLDIERMDAVSPAMQLYFRAWVRRVLADGRYRPGIYAHRANADAIKAGVDAEYAAAGAGGAAAYWLAGGSGFDLTRVPRDVGADYASAWQGRLDVSRTWNGVTLTIDESVAYGVGF
jgi:hypothetical protein